MERTDFIIDLSSTPSPIRGRVRRRSYSSPASVNLTRSNLCGFNPESNTWYNLMNIEIPHIQRICKWCVHGIQKTVDTARSLLFPAERYKRELTVALDRLAQVEQELNRAMAAQEKKSPVQIRQGKNCCPSCLDKEKQKDQEASRLKKATPQLKVNCSVQTCPAVTMVTQTNRKPPLPPAAPVAPPPAAPPPPPVAAPPPKLNITKATRGKPPKIQKQESLPRITMQDLKNVTLRSSTRRNKSPGSRRQSIAVFTQASIAKDLKRSQRKASSTPTSSITDALVLAKDRLPQEIKTAQRKLRKIELKRSPGGTPIIDKEKRRETGQGLTPMMTRALRRKFLMARTPSPNNDENTPPSKRSCRESKC